MERREFLRRIVIGGAVACPLCATFGVSAGQKDAHWGYKGHVGPKHWGTLSDEYKICATGQQQSPIDLHGAVNADLDPILVSYGNMVVTVINNGHTIQANCPPGGTLTASGDSYNLLQFHFHSPSEHTVDGKSFPMEAHFVHQGAGGLAVLGVFITPGAENKLLAPVFDVMPTTTGKEARTRSAIDPAAFLPSERSYYRYAGSLTTPPCTESVNWMVFRQPVEASQVQISKFSAFFPNNRRPVQSLHRRFLLRGS